MSAAISIPLWWCRSAGLALLVTVPMGLLGYRYRIWCWVAAFAAGVVAFLIAGISGFMVVVNCAYIGGPPASSNGGAGHADGDRGVLRGRGAFRVLDHRCAGPCWVRLRTLTFEAMTPTRTAWSPICRNSSRCVPPRGLQSACSLRPLPTGTG